MVIDTNYSIGDAVWCMVNNKPEQAKIDTIYITANEHMIHVRYNVTDQHGNTWLETIVARSEEELLKIYAPITVNAVNDKRATTEIA